MDINRLVRDFRLKLSETQKSLSKVLNISTIAIARYEADRIPDTRFVIRYAALAKKRGLRNFETKFLTFAAKQIGAHSIFIDPDEDLIPAAPPRIRSPYGG